MSIMPSTPRLEHAASLAKHFADGGEQVRVANRMPDVRMPIGTVVVNRSLIIGTPLLPILKAGVMSTWAARPVFCAARPPVAGQTTAEVIAADDKDDYQAVEGL